MKINNLYNCKLKVGLLGGSFNPAHKGHLYISQMAIKQFKLDYVWWLVSPQNPLKSTNDMNSFNERVESCKSIIGRNRKLIISTIEKDFKTCYTFNTISQLKKRFPNIDFAWIMGADNLYQFSKWYKWDKIFSIVPIIVYDRGSFSYKSLKGKAAIKYNDYQLFGRKLLDIFSFKPPVWGFLKTRKHPFSSTEIRNKGLNYLNKN